MTTTTETSTIIARAYGEHYAAVFNYLRRRVNSPAAAEDLTQDVFVKLVEYGGELRESTLKCFLFTIAHTTLCDHLRRTYRRRDIVPGILNEATAATIEPENAIIARDLAAVERREISRLSPQRKTVYVLYRFSERGPDDIAADLALSKRTVENHIFSARQTIRRVMRRHCG